MIDVVFLLIIFFLVSSKMIQEETSIELQLPTARTSRSQENNENSAREEVINVKAEGSILLRNQPVTLEQLKEYFRTKQEQGEQNIQVVIRTNRDVPARTIKPIIMICVQSGIWNVAFKTIQE
jgi:biopolymer transport protein ExbD